MTLKVVVDESPPLSEEELREQGNTLASKIKVAAANATRDSMHSEFFERGTSLSVADVDRWRRKAIEARDSWNTVEALASELINEVKKTANATTMLELREVRPGIYSYVRVPKKEQETKEQDKE